MSELKNPEEYLANIGSITIGLISYYNTNDVLKVIKEVQIDAYNQAIEDAANYAEITDMSSGNVGEYVEWEVDLQSILKLKK